MKYIQKVQPNMDIVEKAGLCLQFVRRSFGAGAVEDNAWNAWENAKYKHADRNFPEGVSVPVFFDWSGNILWTDGVWRWGRYGHVAYRHTDGRIYSAPLSGTGRAWFASVDDLCRAFGNGMKFVGWTRDISNVTVVEEDKAMANITKEEAKTLVNVMRVLNSEAKGWDRNKVHRGETDDREIAYLLGMNTSAVNAIARYSQQAWDEGGNYRASKDTWKAAFAEKGVLQQQIKTLTADLTKLKEQLAKAPVDTSVAEKKLEQFKNALQAVLELK